MSSREPPELPLYRLLVVVRRGDTSLYDRLSNQFRRIDVMWDRRQAERRVQTCPVAENRRTSAHGRRPHVPETWTTQGFVVVTARR